MAPSLAHFADIDQRLLKAARRIKILSTLAWPPNSVDLFLESWHRGDPQLPTVDLRRPDTANTQALLQSIIDDCDEQHPVGRFLARTARSYRIAAAMLAEIGRASFTRHSLELYGGPTDRVGPTQVSNREVAESFLSLSRDLIAASYIPDDAYVLTPNHVADSLRSRIAEVFVDHPIAVVIDAGMASKAAAGARRVRIRAATGFSQNDLDQLLEHEIFVHSATSRNGREQPLLRSLGLGSPRTTSTQEGLATFA
ncbi:MAG TPA: DUF1704 domain-containing protein, partial [Nannocystis exedens]|nr:DUF1704 domain-containing protein [Nannocystis exedens]